METKGSLQKNIRRCAQGAFGFLCSAVCIMGYYPFLPAYFAANCLFQERSLLLYIGMMVGMGYYMSLEMVMKYIFVLMIIAIAIRFYLWANRKCGGFMAGLIAGVTTIAMNFSGHAFVSADQKELLLGISEGVLVLGLTVLIHYLAEMLSVLRLPVLEPEGSGVLQQDVFTEMELRGYVDMMEEACYFLYKDEEIRPRLTSEYIEWMALILLKVKEYERMQFWCDRQLELYTNELSAYTIRLKLYFSMGDRERFFETMEQLRKADVVIDKETLELIRIFS